MSSSTRKAVLGGIGAVVVTLCVVASSWSMSGDKGHGPDPERKVARMTSKLDLTMEQQSAVRSLLDVSVAEGKADAEQLKTLHHSLHAQRAAFDADSTQQIAGELGEVTGRMAYRRASTQAQIYQLLNAQQQTQMDGMTQKRRWRQHHRRKCAHG